MIAIRSRVIRQDYQCNISSVTPDRKEINMKSLPSVYQAKNKVVALLMLFGSGVLLFVNVLLVQQNNRLKTMASRPDRALEVRPGTALPPLEGLDCNGNKHSIGYGQDSRKTVLLVTS